jgi:hypothetical protein
LCEGGKDGPDLKLDLVQGLGSDQIDLVQQDHIGCGYLSVPRSNWFELAL